MSWAATSPTSSNVKDPAPPTPTCSHTPGPPSWLLSLRVFNKWVKQCAAASVLSSVCPHCLTAHNARLMTSLMTSPIFSSLSYDFTTLRDENESGEEVSISVWIWFLTLHDHLSDRSCAACRGRSVYSLFQYRVRTHSFSLKINQLAKKKYLLHYLTQAASYFPTKTLATRWQAGHER